MKRHEFDTISFVSGLAIAGVGVLFLLPRATGDLIHVMSRAALWFWPALFIVAGAAVLIPTLLKRGTDDHESST